MKDFFLGILKNIITYVAMIVIVIVGGISISAQKFPPKWSEIVSAVNTLKNSYAQMLNMRQQMGGLMNMQQQGLAGQIPDIATLESDAATSLEKHETGGKKPDPNTQMTMALIQSMTQQMAQQKQPTEIAAPQTFAPEYKKYLETIQKQNVDMIDRMDKIQVYLSGLHQYLSDARRQPSAVAQPVQPAVQHPGAITVHSPSTAQPTAVTTKPPVPNAQPVVPPQTAQYPRK